MYVIPYVALLTTLFGCLEHYTRDKVVSLYAITISINFLYVCVNNFLQLTPTVIAHCLSLILAYYVFDINYQILTNQPDKWTYITHHIITIQLLLTHVYSMLPMSIGIGYLTFFEYSNTFLQLFQLCHKKGWTTARDIVSLPFVLTYVPLRLIVIPFHSMKYVYFLVTANYSYILTTYLLALISFVDMFSIYFAIVVASKGLKHFLKGEKV